MIMDRTAQSHDGSKLSSEELRRKKTSFTLDFASASESGAGGKNPKQDLRDGILCSPDVGMLALATPDLERFIMQQAYGAAAVATTPPGAAAASIVTTPTQVLYPRSVTEEQEAYARGFLDALVELHRQQQQQQMAASQLLQVVPDHRGNVILPRTSPCDEVQNSLYAAPTPASRAAVVSTGSVTADTGVKRMFPDFMPGRPLPVSGLRPSTLDLSPAARHSVILPTFGAKKFPPFDNDSETLDLSPSGRFPSKGIEQKTADLTNLTVTQSQVCTSNHDGVQQNTVTNSTAVTNSEDSAKEQSSFEASLPTAGGREQMSLIVPNVGIDHSSYATNFPSRPIDMSVQELAKLERKREKNRNAAQKCRLLKLERISRLEHRVNELKQQNKKLADNAGLLREQVGRLRQLIVEHVEGGCQVMMIGNLNTV